MCNAESAICAALSFLFLFPLTIGSVGYFVMLPNADNAAEGSKKDLITYEEKVESAIEVSCELSSEPATPVCFDTIHCTKWYRAPKCPNCHGHDKCLESVPALNCHCNVSVIETSTGNAEPAVVNIGETLDINRDRQEWCSAILANPWPNVVVNVGVTSKQWGCDSTSDGSSDYNRVADPTASLKCMTTLAPGLNQSCLNADCWMVHGGSQHALCTWTLLLRGD
eukprot:gnl/TRDRNA2_/TRDRNA2_138751_c0_seq1.p1 gnl/TRDRNA2_/TRDRNA2_138751_c0~~gnl/TRDRNA2_/TRDRNA2_138751_c0_seq1.p1  ORF type:complete len:233 (-),score=16.31 gnl/TRDRNA2_/TRDRNA2_138751_c0_seq1:247-918(-)